MCVLSLISCEIINNLFEFSELVLLFQRVVVVVVSDA